MTNKTIIVGLVALAFVAGSIMTGTVVYAVPPSSPPGQTNSVQAQIDALSVLLTSSVDSLQSQIDALISGLTQETSEREAADANLQAQIDTKGVGDITDVIPGACLTGGSSSGAAILSLQGDCINPGFLQDNSVGHTELQDGSVGNSELQDSAVTSSKIFPNSIRTHHIVDEEIISEDIKDGTIRAQDIASNTITSDKIADGTITSTDIASGVIPSFQLQVKQNIQNNISIPAGQTGDTFATCGPQDGTLISGGLFASDGVLLSLSRMNTVDSQRWDVSAKNTNTGDAGMWAIAICGKIVPTN